MVTWATPVLVSPFEGLPKGSLPRGAVSPAAVSPAVSWAAGVPHQPSRSPRNDQYEMFGLSLEQAILTTCGHIF